MKLTLKLLCVSFLIVCLTALALAQGAATGDVHVSVACCIVWPAGHV